MSASARRSVAEIDGLVRLIAEACQDAELHGQLARILELPDEHRQLVLRGLLQEMRRRNAPAELAAALACLVDTEVAEKAYEVIFKCGRSDPWPPTSTRKAAADAEHTGPARWFLGTIGLTAVILLLAIAALFAVAGVARMTSDRHAAPAPVSGVAVPPAAQKGLATEISGNPPGEVLFKSANN